MFAVKVKREQTEDMRMILSQRKLIDKKRKFQKSGNYIEIPVAEKIKNYKFPKRSLQIVTQKPVFRYESGEPFESILDKIKMPAYMKRYLPRKWERLGDVLVLKIPEQLEKFERSLAKIYAEVLHAKTVVKDLGIVGEQRRQKIKIILGKCTETVHKENKIKFKLDVNEIMFSSGNMKERKRISSVSNKNETVVDMFAGIGYFSIPLAFYSKPKQIRTYEINPIAYRYLCENIKLNKVRDIIVPHLEDCRNAEEGVADRIVMGYLKDTFIYFPKALRILKSSGGIIHYHEKCPNALLPKQPFEKLKEIALEEGKKIELIKFTNVKSYAPGVSHVVLDIKIIKTK